MAQTGGVPSGGEPPTITVDEVIAQDPSTLQVFRSFGIETYRGGGLPVREAAARAGADPGEVWRALLDALCSE